MKPHATLARIACLALGGLLVLSPGAQADAVAPQPQWITLGTSAGPIPNPQRAQPANLLRLGGDAILVDAGEGVSEQLGKAGVQLGAVGAVFISHLHFDHTGGLFGFLGRRYQTRNPGRVVIYGPPGTRRTVDGLLVAMQPMAEVRDKLAALAGAMPDANIEVVEMKDGSVARLGAVTVSAAVNTHTILDDPSGAGAHSLSFRFDLPGRSIVYTGDTGPSESVERLAKGADLLFCEVMMPERTLATLKATRPDLPAPALAAVMRHYTMQHLSPQEAAGMAQRAGVKALVLTHNGIADEDLAEARRLLAAGYRGPITFATDLQRF